MASKKNSKPKPKKEKPKQVDGELSRKDIQRLRQAIRKVWSWSYARKVCIARATDTDGFGHCEKCKQKVPKVYADHIKKVGLVDEGFITRMWCSSKELQALCKKCHDKKTRDERKEDKELEEMLF
jgi:hypothetical protein